MVSMCAELTLKASVFILKIKKKSRGGIHILSNINDFAEVPSSRGLCTLIHL